MAVLVMMISKLNFRALVFFFFFIWVFVSTLGQNLLSCNNTSLEASSDYRCTKKELGNQCGTFVILRTNSHFSSLFNLSYYLGINRFVIAEANGFSTDTEFLPKDQPLLIPIECKCNGGLFESELTKTTIAGESFSGISESLEGLTTCKAIQEKNPDISPYNLADKVRLLIPLKCACPSSSEVSLETRLLLSYPVREGDTILKLALSFNSNQEAIVSANKNRSGGTFSPARLVPLSTLLIPLNGEPALGALVKPNQPSLASSIPAPIIRPPHKKRRRRMRTVRIYIVVTSAVIGAIIAISVALLVLRLNKKKQQISRKKGDLELQQLSLSVRTMSDKKVSFEGSQDTLDGRIIDTATPRKMLVESYVVDELKKATEDFNSSNLIEGSVFHGRLKGKNMAIKRTNHETISKIDFGLFHDAVHRHPNIMRLLGTCLTDGCSDSFLIFEYAENGSLKDWLHGGLAMKSHFIASCNCFLTWNQRLKICLDVAMALKFMHHIMNPSYVHRNIKTRNIFLDEEFNAKIGNFGLAGCVVENDDDDNTEESKSSSAHPALWSKGYSAPEFLNQGVISTNTDIFAYGVVLLEVLSGKTPITESNIEGEKSVMLSEKIKSILQSDNADELKEWMDNALGDNYLFDDAVTLANVARACIEEDPSLRPSAGEIVEKLSSLVEEVAVQDGAEHLLSCESSSKPLVMAAANNSSSTSF